MIRATLIATMACVMSSSAAQSNIAALPGDAVAGRSQAEWSVLWWQWAGSFEYDNSPVADRTGNLCHLKQKGPVWFLAGTYGTHRTVRTCKVPKGKYLFFPLINYVVSPDGVHPCSECCPNYVRTAREITDNPSYLIVDLDGQRLQQPESYRQVSPGCFDLGALSNP